MKTAIQKPTTKALPVKRITHIEHERRAYAELVTQVLNVLGWDELKYARFQEGRGHNYLLETFGHKTPMLQEIPKHKIFWSWWKVQWMKRDRSFLDMLNLLKPNEYQEYYRDLHDPCSMPFRPHSETMARSYESMISNLIKEAVS